MKLSPQALEELAARALKRQLGQVHPISVDTSRAAIPDAGVVQPSTELTRFDTLTSYRQLDLMRRLAEQFGIESPFFRVHEGTAGSTTRINGQEYINFASYNYLGFAGSIEVSERAKAAIDQYGTSSSASRMVAGERPIHQQLERALASFYEVDDCVVLVGGHATNVTTLSTLFGGNDLIVHDALAHNSIVQGAQLSGAKRMLFPHNDWRALDGLLQRARSTYERVLIVVEGLYSMDGDVPDLPHFVEVKRKHAAFLMVDEAHSLGVLGSTGRGIREHHRVHPLDVDIWMGTLSKTLGGCGGFIAGNSFLIDILRHTAPGFMYSVGLPPPLAAASLASLDCLIARPERVGKLRKNGLRFLEGARRIGLQTGGSAGFGVVPVIAGSSKKAAEWSNALFAQGINVQPIFYPAVEENLARLRFFICSTHTEEQIDAALAALEHIL